MTDAKAIGVRRRAKRPPLVIVRDGEIPGPYSGTVSAPAAADEPDTDPTNRVVDAAELLGTTPKPRDYFSQRLGVVRGTRPWIVQSWPGEAKTTLATEMAVSVALGRGECWGGVPLACGGRVLYIDGESGPDEWRLLVRRLCVGLGVDPRELRGRLSYVHAAGARLDDESAEGWLMGGTSGYALGVVDTLRALVSTRRRENDSDFAEATYMLGRVSVATGITWLALAHESKPTGDDTDGAIQRRRKHMLRGTGALSGAVHAQWAVSRRKGDVFELSHAKGNAGPLRDPLRVAIEDVGEPDSITGDSPGLRVVAVAENRLDAHVDAALIADAKAALIASAKRAKSPLSKNALVTGTRGRSDHKREALRLLIDEGAFAVEPAAPGKPHLCTLKTSEAKK